MKRVKPLKTVNAKTVNESILIEAIASNSNLSKPQAERALNAIIDSIGAALKQGNKVQLTGLGTFDVTRRSAREGRNPRTGEVVTIAARNLPTFKPGKGLRDLISGNKAYRPLRQQRYTDTSLIREELSAKALTTPNDQDKVKEAFLKRSYHALQRLIESAPSEELVEALAAPTDIGGISRLLSDIGALQPEYTALDPWAEFLAKGVIVKQELLRQAGGAFTTSQVADMLGISRQAVQQRVRRGRLLAMEGGTAERYYPALQFGDNGTVEGLEEVLAAFTVADPWTRLSVLLDTDDLLGGRRVIDALRAGEREEVLRVVRSFGN